ncbi:MAG: Fe-S protein assembly co-chaperone HscB [Sutterellaceae bacterium]|nr:Fe-S protein assembly co-chaperone HscB [Sutterellaceae bacterium]
MAQNSPFAVLALPERFDLAEDAIQEAWRKTIAVVHPDRFADRPAAERRVAEQWAGRINEAKDALLDPVKRAQALLLKLGLDIGAETDTKMSPAFLMEQMQWREDLEDAQTQDDLNALLTRVDAARGELLAALTETLDVTPDAAKAREAVRRLMFVQKIREELLRKGAVH